MFQIKLHFMLTIASFCFPRETPWKRYGFWECDVIKRPRFGDNDSFKKNSREWPRRPNEVHRCRHFGVQFVRRWCYMVVQSSEGAPRAGRKGSRQVSEDYQKAEKHRQTPKVNHNQQTSGVIARKRLAFLAFIFIFEGKKGLGAKQRTVNDHG